MKQFLKAAALTVLTALLLSGGAGAAKTEFLIPGGETIGLQLRTDGVSIVEFAEDNPGARSAGLKKGDRICEINGQTVKTTQEVADLVERSNGQPMTVTVRRGKAEKTVRFAPQKTKDGWRLGVYVRDGINGVGTVTFYDPSNGMFGALGHGVMDGSELLALQSGEVYPAQIASVRRGKVGEPGALQGATAAVERCGHIEKNTQRGIFGETSLPDGKKAIAVARAAETHTGSAQIYSCVKGQDVREYAIEILKIDLRDANGRNFLIEVTDSALLAQTGGIVQGM